MNRVEELIQQLCPNGVEWKKLGEVCEFQNGFSFKSSTFKKQGKPILRITNIKDSVIDTASLVYFEDMDYIGQELSQFKVVKGDIVIAMSGATTGKLGYLTSDEIFYLNQRVGKFVPKSNLDRKYLFHYLQLKTNEIYVMAGGGAQPNLSSTKLLNDFSIPIPPLPIQQEIVRILDTFTELQKELTANLQTELDARKKQYAYYRDCLLNFEGVDGVEWKKLGEIGTFIRGNGLQKKDFTEKGTGCIHYGQIYTCYNIFTYTTKSFVDNRLADKLTRVDRGDIIIACTSENIEDVCKAVAWLGDDTIVTGGHACVFKHQENPKFISYYFQSEFFFQQKKKYARGTKVIDIKVSDLEKIEIPIPPLPEQRRIVAILDHFETLVNDLSVGLPAELEARRKQYEYYRDKLLTFDRV